MWCWLVTGGRGPATCRGVADSVLEVGVQRQVMCGADSVLEVEVLRLVVECGPESGGGSPETWRVECWLETGEGGPGGGLRLGGGFQVVGRFTKKSKPVQASTWSTLTV